MKHALYLTSACVVIALAGPTPTFAASSDWTKVDGANVRLVTTGAADDQGVLRGMLEIDLQPGWTTYWRDPGDAGVPPSVDVSASTNIDRADVDFPVPERHHNGDYASAGYDRPVALPIRFHAADPKAASVITADIFLGICQEICVPVQSKLTVDTSAGQDDASDRVAVDAAFAALPAVAMPGFRVALSGVEGEVATFETELPAGAKATDLFLAATEGYYFGAPKQVEKDGKTYFTFKAMRPATPPAGGQLRYTLVADTGSVSGTVPAF